jgi:hypothetical protein
MSATRIEMLASATQSATGNSAAFSVPTLSMAMIGVDITAFSGTTPTFTAWLQASDDGGTTWYDVPNDLALISATTAATGTMSATARRNIIDTLVISVAQKHYALYRQIPSDTVRLNWVISGTTPTITLSASLVAK